MKLRPIAGVMALAMCVRPLAAGAAPPLVTAAAPLRMAPASKWVMDYADDSCALRRQFQGGKDTAILELREFGPGDVFQVLISSDTLSGTKQPARVRFEPDDSFSSPQTYFFDDGQTHGVVFHDSLSPNAAAQTRKKDEQPRPATERDARERAITGLSLTGSFTQGVVLETGAMHAPMEAMRACLDELLDHWGLDAAVQRTLSRPAEPRNMMAWARRLQEAYPKKMLDKDRSGEVNIRLIVGPDGTPTKCIPNKDFSASDFSEQACELSLSVARFHPALDANGKPVASFYTTAIAYTITFVG